MSTEYIDKFVEFDKYCRTCKHKDKNDNEPPCDTCMQWPVQQYSHKPMCWEDE